MIFNYDKAKGGTTYGASLAQSQMFKLTRYACSILLKSRSAVLQ